MSTQVAIVVHNYFEQAELESPLTALKDAGYSVHILTTSGEDNVQAMQGDVNMTKTFPVDAQLDDANLADYAAVVIPGGTVNADNLRTNSTAQQWAKTALEQGKPLAVICHGPWLLVSSGLAKGKSLTSYPSLRDDVVNAGGEWIDQEVVVDGNLITSRNPDDLPAFNEAILEQLR